MSLENMILEAAKNGGLTALTVWKTGKGFQCNVRRGQGWVCVVHSDPVAGVREALNGEPSEQESQNVDAGDIFG